MNKLEILQNETSGFNYIKSYPILKKLFKAQLNISIIELILSYTSNGLEFYMNYKNIAEILSTKEQSIRNTIKSLSQQGYLITDNVKKYNNKSGVGGSSTKIVVDLDKIITDIDNPITKAVKKEEPKATKPKSVTIPTEDIKEVITIEETDLPNPYECLDKNGNLLPQYTKPKTTTASPTDYI
jgi:hypothetical protein